MTTFLPPDDPDNVDFAEARRDKRDRRVACFLHLRDLVHLHSKAASPSAVAFVQKLEAAVIAAREKRLTDARERERREADRQKAAAGQTQAAPPALVV